MEEIIELPVNVHFIKDSQNKFSPSRTEKELPAIFEEINRIWSKAQIKFNLTDTHHEEIDEKELKKLIDLFCYEKPPLNSNLIDIYFVKGIKINQKKINGFAQSDIRRVFLNDFTTVNDFCCIAHELGHILRLKDAYRSGLLMNNRGNEQLQEHEIKIARHMAKM